MAVQHKQTREHQSTVGRGLCQGAHFRDGKHEAQVDGATRALSGRVRLDLQTTLNQASLAMWTGSTSPSPMPQVPLLLLGAVRVQVS